MKIKPTKMETKTQRAYRFNPDRLMAKIAMEELGYVEKEKYPESKHNEEIMADMITVYF
jgi:hypothetical protein